MPVTTETQNIGVTGYVIPVIDYDNIEESSQALLWAILRNDADVGGGSISTKKINVLDTPPDAISSGAGYPYLIVPPPKVTEDYTTFSKKMMHLQFTCELYFLQNKVGRKMLGHIRSCIRRNIGLFGRPGSFRLEQAIVDTDWEPFPLADGKMAYKSNVSIRFEALVDYIGGT